MYWVFLSETNTIKWLGCQKKYLMHMENKEWCGILIFMPFTFCFYSSPFQSLASIRQRSSPHSAHYFEVLHRFITHVWYAGYNCLDSLTVDLSPSKQIREWIKMQKTSLSNSFWYGRYLIGHYTRLDIHTAKLPDWLNTLGVMFVVIWMPTIGKKQNIAWKVEIIMISYLSFFLICVNYLLK